MVNFIEKDKLIELSYIDKLQPDEMGLSRAFFKDEETAGKFITTLQETQGETWYVMDTITVTEEIK
jgi:hypothetical protein